MNDARVEAELKYLAVDEAPLLELEAAATLGPAMLGVPATAREIDRYVDTHDLRLAGVRWACRLRTRDRQTIVSLKGPAEHLPADLLHLRPELEGPATPALDPREWPSSSARELLLRLSGGELLVERFTLEQERTERSVSVGDLRLGLLSLDRVRVVSGDAELGRMLVVELEFSGPVGELDDEPLASALGHVAGLTADPMGKFERALALLPAG